MERVLVDIEEISSVIDTNAWSLTSQILPIGWQPSQGELGATNPTTNRNEMKTCFHWTCFSFEQDLPVRSICCVGGDSISFVVVDSKNYFQQRNVNKIYYRSSRFSFFFSGFVRGGWTLSLNWIILHSVEFTTAKVRFWWFRLSWNSRNVSLIIAKVDIV